MSDVDASRQASELWNSVAPAWERHRRHTFERLRSVSEWLVDHVDPSPGQTVLEVGAGPGDTGCLAAQRVEPGGRLISTDVAPAMVEAAQRVAQERGITNVEHRVMDARHLDLPDDSVDAVISRFVLMLVPEPDRALAEIHRVLRPGGRLAYATWGAMDANPWVTVLIGAVLQSGQVPPTGGPLAGGPFAPGGLFSLSTAADNDTLLTAAGFHDVTTQELDGTMDFDSFEEYFDVQTGLAAPLTQLVRTLSPEQLASVRAAAQAAAEPYRTDGGYAFPYSALAVACS